MCGASRVDVWVLVDFTLPQGRSKRTQMLAEKKTPTVKGHSQQRRYRVSGLGHVSFLLRHRVRTGLCPCTRLRPGSWNGEKKLTRQYVRDLVRDLALEEWQLLCKELRDQSGGSLVETFDACTMAYFRKVLQQTRADESETSAFAMRIVDEIPRFCLAERFV